MSPKFLKPPSEAAKDESAYCSRCPLKDRPYVPGEGYTDCKVLIVGSAPGEQEEREGTVFKGVAGELLRAVLSGLGVAEDVYLTNLVKRRPTAADGSQRKPTKTECYHCGQHLVKELDRHQPKIVMTVGQTPTQFFFGKGQTVTQIHGLPITMNRTSLEVTVIPTFDPSYVIRRGGLNSTIGDQFLADVEELRKTMRKEGL